MIAIVIVLLLVPIPFKGRWAIALGDMVHTPLFGGVTLAILGLLQRSGQPSENSGKRLWVRCLCVGIAVFCFGASMELVQHISGRTGTLHDATANALGIIAAICVFLAWVQPKHWPARTKLRSVLIGAALCAVAAGWTRPISMLGDEWVLRREFPVLSSFNSNTEITRWYFRECSGQLTTRHKSDGANALAIAYQPTENPSATLVQMKRDWSQMETLELDVTLQADYPAQELRFVTSVLDVHHAKDFHDVFSRGWILKPGVKKHIVITRDEILNGPGVREMDLSKIEFLDLGIIQPVAKTTVYVDAVKLTLSRQ